MIRTYSELVHLPTFEERFRYLKLTGSVGKATFGYDRYLNQNFYKSNEWKRLRNEIIVRDNGCEMSLDGFEIGGKIFIHHMNPINEEDIVNNTDYLLNPEYLVCVSHDVHNAIHYGDDSILRAKIFVERRPNDTCPWKEKK
jgi:hypothetical protein